jgi:type I restriction-modification system DNA methylase subunit
MEMNKEKILEHKLCKEIELIEQKYENNAGEMSVQDIDKIDKLYHALKSMATYNAMKEAEEYAEDGLSGRRGRGMNGQYVSRDMGPGYSGNYYDDGYSGHYPITPPRYPRW